MVECYTSNEWNDSFDKVECCFDKIERCFDIVAVVDEALAVATPHIVRTLCEVSFIVQFYNLITIVFEY